MKIVADDKIPFLKGVLEPYAEVTYRPGGDIGPQDVREADALLVRTRTRCDASLLEGSRVRYIGTATIGYDHIDTAYCRDHGIRVATAAGCNANGVAHYLAGVLAHLHREGLFSAPGKVLGVVGAGHVGSRIAGLGEAVGMRVVCCDPPLGRKDYVSLEELLEVSDLVSLHVPYTRKGPYATDGMADEKFFSRMKRGAFFVNSSRGEVVDETALLRALEGKRVAGAVIDVWRGEPDIDRRLLDRALLATPHIAGYSLQGKANGTALTVRQLAAHYGWPLTNWYPPGIPQPEPDRPTWKQLLERMPTAYDPAADSARLKAAPERFEDLRNHYDYRTEFFS